MLPSAASPTQLAHPKSFTSEGRIGIQHGTFPQCSLLSAVRVLVLPGRPRLPCMVLFVCVILVFGGHQLVGCYC